MINRLKVSFFNRSKIFTIFFNRSKVFKALFRLSVRLKVRLA
jgi:hypothetical protein